MLGAFAQSCCCDSGCERDGIWQTEIQSGCCHKDDTLLLWCQRPGFQQKVQAGCPDGFGPGAGWKEFCCVTTTSSEVAIQAIYHYEECYYRCQQVGALGIAEYDGLAEMCPPANCDQPFGVPTACSPYLDTTCTTGACGAALQSGCCNDPDWNAQPWSKNCLACCDTCNDGAMSNWRRERMSCTSKWNWIVEAVCQKNGANLGTGGDCDTISYSGGSFSNCTRLSGIAQGSGQLLCVVHFERWWKIATCPTGARIYVPGCLQTGGTADCGGNVCQTDDLVPERWIFAGSGIPFYAGDLIDAVRFSVITSGEAVQFLEDLFGTCQHPDQVILQKLATAGYLRSNDWRDEQRMAYQELHARFPTAGYDAYIQDVVDMHTLGPFRKRMTYKTVGTSTNPLLRRNNVVNNPDLDPLQADGFRQFPGGTQDDYDYWCARQWVYFRGRPGGWQWVGWFPSLLCPGNEILSVLLGGGRADPSCIDALTGNTCRHPPIKAACTCCNTTASIGIPVTCRGCDTYDCAFPLPGCYAPDICQTFSAKPYCQGMHFKYAVHDAELTLRAPDGSSCNPGSYCGSCTKIACLYTQHSFLTEARRTVDSWLDSIPYTCRNEKPPLPVYNTWQAWIKAHPAPESSICNLASIPSQDVESWCWGCGCQLDGDPPCAASEYTDRLCCGGMCEDGACDCDPCAVDPYEGPQANECSERFDCPPHSNLGQTTCIGFTPTCNTPV